MSTNKTENYQLHAWEPGDDFLLSEINENFAKLDADAVRVVFGSYIGDQPSTSAAPQHIELGVKPRAVLALRSSRVSYSGNDYIALGGPDHTMQGAMTLEDTGFSVANNPQKSIYLNWENQVHYYMALV